MRLHTTSWGSGDRIALLVHGMMADHRTWRRVGPALAERGYRVIAVDLRGHGRSGRAAGPEEYRPEDHADDLVETLPAGAEVAVGHSLGGLVLARALGRLASRRARSTPTPRGTSGRALPATAPNCSPAGSR